jgi:UDP-N-acetylmuramate--alanine ligase
MKRTQRCLRKSGCRIFSQDGSGITGSTDALVVSTAIEEDNPERREAAKRNIPILHRSDILAAITRQYRTIAIAGTSGKSTVTALCFDCIRSCGKSPSLITGAYCVSLIKEERLGNAFVGDSDLLIIEADESDGSLVKYHPFCSVFLNISTDHHDIDETMGYFTRLAAQSQTVIVNADDSRLTPLPANRTFGMDQTADFHPDKVEQIVPKVSFVKSGIYYTGSLPGEHNLSNILAALCASSLCGCPDDQLRSAIESFQGVQRRFTVHTLSGGIICIDDYAHNPEKIRAALRCAQLLAGRVFALFQPHGFGPLRVMRTELVKMFAETLRENDRLILLPVYYAGGTAQKDISSKDIAVDLRKISPHAIFTPRSRNSALQILSKRVKPGNCILSMGARDPTLASFSRQIQQTIQPD